MAIIDLMSWAPIYEASLQGYMLSNWASLESLSPVCPQAGELGKQVPSCPEPVMLTQQHHLVADVYESTQRYRKVFGHAMLETYRWGPKKKKNFFFLNFQGSQDNWLLESPLLTQKKLLAAALSRAHQLGRGRGGGDWNTPSKTGLR